MKHKEFRFIKTFHSSLFSTLYMSSTSECSGQQPPGSAASSSGTIFAINMLPAVLRTSWMNEFVPSVLCEIKLKLNLNVFYSLHNWRVNELSVVTTISEEFLCGWKFEGFLAPCNNSEASCKKILNLALNISSFVILMLMEYWSYHPSDIFPPR